MTALEHAISGMTQSIGSLTSARSTSGAWADIKRHELDRARLDPLEQDSKQLLEALTRAGRAIADAQARLVR